MHILTREKKGEKKKHRRIDPGDNVSAKGKKLSIGVE